MVPVSTHQSVRFLSPLTPALVALRRCLSRTRAAATPPRFNHSGRSHGAVLISLLGPHFPNRTRLLQPHTKGQGKARMQFDNQNTKRLQVGNIASKRRQSSPQKKSQGNNVRPNLSPTRKPGLGTVCRLPVSLALSQPLLVGFSTTGHRIFTRHVAQPDITRPALSLHIAIRQTFPTDAGSCKNFSPVPKGSSKDQITTAGPTHFFLRCLTFRQRPAIDQRRRDCGEIWEGDRGQGRKG